MSVENTSIRLSSIFARLSYKLSQKNMERIHNLMLIWLCMVYIERPTRIFRFLGAFLRLFTFD